MNPEQIFLILWFIVMISLFSIFIIRGRRTLLQFPKMNDSEFEFIENRASGYSCQSFRTKMGGAKNVLRIRVTKNELWITTNTFMAFIAEKFDLIHVIPINELVCANKEGKKINIEFTKNGIVKRIVIVSRKQNELVSILTNKIERLRNER